MSIRQLFLGSVIVILSGREVLDVSGQPVVTPQWRNSGCVYMFRVVLSIVWISIPGSSSARSSLILKQQTNQEQNKLMGFSVQPYRVQNINSFGDKIPHEPRSEALHRSGIETPYDLATDTRHRSDTITPHRSDTITPHRSDIHTPHRSDIDTPNRLGKDTPHRLGMENPDFPVINIRNSNDMKNTNLESQPSNRRNPRRKDIKNLRSHGVQRVNKAGSSNYHLAGTDNRTPSSNNIDLPDTHRLPFDDNKTPRRAVIENIESTHQKRPHFVVPEKKSDVANILLPNAADIQAESKNKSHDILTNRKRKKDRKPAFRHTHQHGRNLAFDFLRGIKPKPVPEALSENHLINQINKLRKYPQLPNPSSDRMVGPMAIKWDEDAFFVRFGNDEMARTLGIRRSPHSSIGGPWPLPNQFARNQNKIFTIDQDKFVFRSESHVCDILSQAYSRYRNYILNNTVEDLYDNLQHSRGSSVRDPWRKYDSDIYKNAPIINSLDVHLVSSCKGKMYPSLTSNESYHIMINEKGAVLVAGEVWGVLRGLETFSQLLWRGCNNQLYVMETVVIDRPRFPHRGILLDTARHFIFKEVILDILDGMEQNKMNVFHWHMTDDQSFPFQSKKFPEMSLKGAFHPLYVYTHKDVAEIVEYARLRGIRVIPEFDIPGHAYAWGLGKPDLLAECYSKDNIVEGLVGPMDPSKETTYTFLKSFFEEILELFPDQYLHAGGDEVPIQCWDANKDIMRRGKKLIQSNPNLNNRQGYYSSQMYSSNDLWQYFHNRFMQDMKELRDKKDGIKYILWQEAALKTNIKLVNDTITQIWLGDAMLVSDAIQKGYRVLYSACWYLNMIQFGPDWPKYYTCDPAFPGQGVDETKVLGGEACLWVEFLDNEDIMTALWPRASAVAERLWSDRNVISVDAAAPRMHEHRCRMLNRGLSVSSVSGPDYCLRSRRIKSRERSDYLTVVKHLSEGNQVIQNSSSFFRDLLVVLIEFLIVLFLFKTFVKNGVSIKLLKLVKGNRKSAIFIIFLCICILFTVLYSNMWMTLF